MPVSALMLFTSFNQQRLACWQNRRVTGKALQIGLATGYKSILAHSGCGGDRAPQAVSTT
jgi:hypothetical protein